MKNKTEKQIMVSVRCITYNQVQYIKQTLEGFVNQKTNFSFEVIVHDDASTDGTTDIIKDYESRYPEIIHPIYETENVYSKSILALDEIMINACVGKYTALCEGDDYWTDPYKLQKQVNYMEMHPECGLCYTDCDVFYEETKQWQYSIFRNGLSALIDSKNPFFSGKGGYKANVTWLYRSNMATAFVRLDGVIDTALELLYNFCAVSEIAFLPDVTAVYRRHIGSESCISPKDKKKRYRLACNTFKMSLVLASRFEKRCLITKQLYENNLSSLYRTALQENDTEILDIFREYYSDTIDMYFIDEILLSEISARTSHAYRLGRLILTPFKKICRR